MDADHVRAGRRGRHERRLQKKSLQLFGYRLRWIPLERGRYEVECHIDLTCLDCQ